MSGLPAGLLARALAAMLILGSGLLLYVLANRVILARAQRNTTHAQEELPFQLNGQPVILYFTSPDCAPCKTVQRPALQRLQERLGERLQVVEVNAQQRPDLASRWGVLSVPTTFVIDGQGQLRHINHGATRAEKLYQQLDGIV